MDASGGMPATRGWFGPLQAIHLVLLCLALGLWIAIEFFGLPAADVMRSLFADGSLLVLSVVLLAVTLLMLGAGLWVAMALLAAGFIALALTGRPVGNLMASTIWGDCTETVQSTVAPGETVSAVAFFVSSTVGSTTATLSGSPGWMRLDEPVDTDTEQWLRGSATPASFEATSSIVRSAPNTMVVPAVGTLNEATAARVGSDGSMLAGM